MNQQNQPLHPGDQWAGFVVARAQKLPKLALTFYELKHQVTGAKYIHLENQDNNNLFGVAFPTVPQDSTGVAHILEHTALCGSKSFPVRDPFFSMIKRSLNTFMNAFTASDWTMYPFASQNEKDFYNLMRVYLDAAFYPRLTKLNFKQEGHRVEFAAPNNPQSPLVFKGVVYNEMKGAMSQQGSIMYRAIGKALFPTLTYRHNSGGDPKRILDLTHEGLKAFHAKHYHPSNAFFYSYGNLPLTQHLERVQAWVLKDFTALEVDTSVPREQRYQSRHQEEATYPLDAAEDDGSRCQALMAWLTCDIQDALEVLTLEVLNLVLLGSSGAPLRKALLESRLGKSLADGTGFENDIRECWFGVGLQGVQKEDFPQVEQLILDCLGQIVEEGIQAEEVESALHQLEMDTREVSGGRYPYALNLLFRFFGAWMHGGDPVQALDFDQVLERLREKLQAKGFLEGKIKEYFLENPHRVWLTLSPDPTQAAADLAEEKERLTKLKEVLTPEEEQEILQSAQALQALQEEEEDLSCLPTLERSDIPIQVEGFAPTVSLEEGKKLSFYAQPTNGILYVHWNFRLPALSEEEQKWLPLLGSLVTQTGAGGLSYDQTAQRVARHSGGYSLSPQLIKYNGGR